MSMVDSEAPHPDSRGCLAVLAGMFTLVLVSPFAVVIQRWRRWRRGSALISTIEVRQFNTASDSERRWVDLTLDVPVFVEPGFRRRFTESVVRVADTLRRPDDVYNVIYTLPGDPEPVVLPEQACSQRSWFFPHRSSVSRTGLSPQTVHPRVRVPAVPMPGDRAPG